VFLFDYQIFGSPLICNPAGSGSAYFCNFAPNGVPNGKKVFLPLNTPVGGGDDDLDGL
jgi:hypothetical protein